MQPAIEAAIIAAGSTGVVAIVGFMTNVRTTAKVVTNAEKTAHDERWWAKEAAIYEELLAVCSRQVAIRDERLGLVARRAPAQETAEPGGPGFDWFGLEGRIRCYASVGVLDSFKEWRHAEETAATAKSYRAEMLETAKANNDLERMTEASNMTAEVEDKCRQANIVFHQLVQAVQGVLKREKAGLS